RHGHSSGYSLTGSITTSLGGGLGVTIKAREKRASIVASMEKPGCEVKRSTWLMGSQKSKKPA
ncbi:hypothetical protein, partial [Citrobacter freundii]|uniref:hypothetical protein n=1 Tax=Citrobacter freundii TaxID=546 RepID=UPI001BD07006